MQWSQRADRTLDQCGWVPVELRHRNTVEMGLREPPDVTFVAAQFHLRDQGPPFPKGLDGRQLVQCGRFDHESARRDRARRQLENGLVPIGGAYPVDDRVVSGHDRLAVSRWPVELFDPRGEQRVGSAHVDCRLHPRKPRGQPSRQQIHNGRLQRSHSGLVDGHRAESSVATPHHSRGVRATTLSLSIALRSWLQSTCPA